VRAAESCFANLSSVKSKKVLVSPVLPVGLVFGLAGRSIYIAGYQQWFSIGMGILVLSLALLYFIQKKIIHLSFLNKFYHAVQGVIVRLLKSSTGIFGFFLVGIANGLLPCGMVYIALASTLSLSQISESVLFMALFGAGTLPAMMLVGYAGQLIKPGIRHSFQKTVPVFIALMGAILILRGMNLGIPFISPQLPQAAGIAVNCHP
jgi:sulfite exporter TauE/SafE